MVNFVLMPLLSNFVLVAVETTSNCSDELPTTPRDGSSAAQLLRLERKQLLTLPLIYPRFVVRAVSAT
jgi:hypothetical protein